MGELYKLYTYIPPIVGYYELCVFELLGITIKIIHAQEEKY